MFKPITAFSGFSVDDLDKAKQFYGQVLGLKLTDEIGGVRVALPEGNQVWMYPKGDLHVAAMYTMLDFVVDDINEAVDVLAERGVKFERYEDGPPQDGRGVMRGIAQGMGPDIAWFKDPAGNILAVLQQA
jgi:catechol 2,3-dioxygenase-like lactoylglutathione lyase family enzyme